MIRILLLSLTLSSALSLKIRIPKNLGAVQPTNMNQNMMNNQHGLNPIGGSGYNHMNMNSGSQMHHPTQMMTHPAGFALVKTCQPMAPSISTADLLSIFSKQMFQNISNNQFQILLIRHESQLVYGGSEHLVLYRLYHQTNNEVTYYGMKVMISHSGVTKIKVFLQSADLNQVITVIGFSDQRVFNYSCVNFQQTCVTGFLKIAAKIYTSSIAVNYYQQHVPSFVPPPTNFMQYLYGNYGAIPIPSNVHNMNQSGHVSNDPHLPSVDVDDSPFHTIKAKINITRPDGSVIKIGSAKPKSD